MISYCSFDNIATVKQFSDNKILCYRKTSRLIIRYSELFPSQIHISADCSLCSCKKFSAAAHKCKPDIIFSAFIHQCRTGSPATEYHNILDIMQRKTCLRIVFAVYYYIFTVKGQIFVGCDHIKRISELSHILSPFKRFLIYSDADEDVADGKHKLFIEQALQLLLFFTTGVWCALYNLCISFNTDKSLTLSSSVNSTFTLRLICP